MDFNSALKGVGDYGRYQKLLILFLVVPSGCICALLYFAQYFIILIPEDYSCKLNLPPELTSEEASKVRELGIPKDPTTDKLHRCQMYDVDALEKFHASVTAPNSSWTTIECRDGWEYNYGNLYPTIVTELDLVCSRHKHSYNIQLLFYTGTWIGSIIFGFMADCKGRRWSIFISFFIALVSGIASSFAKSLPLFMLCRLLLGMCIIPLSEDPFVLALEYTGAKKRTWVIASWAFSYVVSSAACPWLAYAIGHWSYLSLATSIPLVVVVCFGWYIPESAGWLLTRGRTEEAKKYLAMIGRINKREFPPNLDLKDLTRDKDYEKQVGVKDVLRSPVVRKHMILNLLVWFVTYCCYHTNVYNTSFLGTDVYLAYTLGAVLELPALPIMVFLVNWMGRRWPMVVSTGVAGVVGVFSIFCSKDASETILVLSLIMRICLTTEYNIILQYSAEVFPTVLRGRCLAVLRVGGSVSLFVVPSIVYLSQQNPTYPMVISGAMCLFLSSISLFLPETMGKPMPQTLDDSEKLGADHKVCECPCIEESPTTSLAEDDESRTAMSHLGVRV